MSGDLGDGLILRPGRGDDTEPLVAWATEAFREPDGSVDEGVLLWMRDLQDRPHPTFRPEYWRVVEEPGTGRIVSALCLIPQTWRYEGIEIPVGRIEIVGTLAEFRRRGLVSALMEEIHGLSDGRGDLMQTISGIPWFYRRFGYEMALAMHANRRLPIAAVPKLADGTEETCAFRAAVEYDVGFVADLAAAAGDRYLATCVRDEAAWITEVAGRTPGAESHRAVEVIERAGMPVGFVAYWPVLERGRLYVQALELVEGVSWGEVAPAVFRRLAAVAGDADTLVFTLGGEHPLYEAASHLLDPGFRSYAWYVRVADVVGFLRHVTPVLEWRLGDGPFGGHTGSLRLSWYHGGVRLGMDGGLLTVEDWSPEGHEDGDMAFPGLTFLSLLFGHRSLSEVRDAHPDCVIRTPSAAPLVEALFPQRPSWVWALD